MPGNSSAHDKRRFQTLLIEFQEAAVNNLDEDEKLLMQYIAENAEAPGIFGAIEDDVAVKRLLSLCVDTYFLARNFNNLVAEARRVLAKEPEYKRAIATIEQMLKETQVPVLDRLAAYTLPDPDRILLEKRALESIKDRVRTQIRIANETILRLGATRKSRGRKAAESAAIGWMAEGVKRMTKSTNSRLSADLAELVLGCEVSLDRVANAAETRKRKWRS